MRAVAASIAAGSVLAGVTAVVMMAMRMAPYQHAGRFIEPLEVKQQARKLHVPHGLGHCIHALSRGKRLSHRRWCLLPASG